MENERVKIAYLVIAYMDPEQLKRLAARLTGMSDVYVHINSSVDMAPFWEALKDIKGGGQVFFSRERYRIVWAGFSILQATFSMLEQALSEKNYDRVVLLTGLDYPIKSDEAIQTFFREHMHTEFVHAHLVTGETHEELCYQDCRDNRFLHRMFGYMNGVLKAVGKKGKADYVMHEGQRYSIYGISPKWALSGECAAYLLDFYKKNRRFNQYFQMMHAPDDYYVATVLYNSPYREKIESKEDIFKIIWLPEDRGAKVLEAEDLEELCSCGQLYAKKFLSGHSEELEKMLDERAGTKC